MLLEEEMTEVKCLRMVVIVVPMTKARRRGQKDCGVRIHRFEVWIIVIVVAVVVVVKKEKTKVRQEEFVSGVVVV